MQKRTKEIKRKKLTVEIAGGLGNQLFMFYGGLYFGKHLNRVLKYNTLNLKEITHRHPGLNIQELGLFQEEETESQLFSRFQKVLWKLKREARNTSLASKFLSPVLSVEEIGFVSPQFVSSKTIFLQGYFQSWKFFDSLLEKPTLTHECIPSPSDWFKEMKDLIDLQNPGVLHVRRGDYGLAENQSIGLLSKKYYEDAISFLNNSNPIWVFSDSPDLVETEFQGLDRELIFIKPPKESDPVESLFLMSLASEIVISNSSFSWWAAFLSKKNKKIFAPSKWYKSRQDPVDLVPSNWVRIESKWM